MGHPRPIKIVIIKKCPKLLRIYGNGLHLFFQAAVAVVIEKCPKLLRIYGNVVFSGCRSVL